MSDPTTPRPRRGATAAVGESRVAMDAERSSSARATAVVFVASRAWVLLFVAAAYARFGVDRANAHRYDAPAVASPFGGAGRALIDVWARWDSTWYLGIAHSGYGHRGGGSAAFFPFYPALSRGLAEVGGLLSPGSRTIYLSALLASLALFAVALYVLHRLCELEIGRDAATLTCALLAFFPMALFYGSIYSESAFLACSVAAVWFARIDRWALAGLLGAGAAATRSAGVLVAVPLALIYLLGPRGRGERARPYLGAPWRRLRGGRATYPLRAEALWILLVPAGVAAFSAYLWITRGDPGGFGDAQAFWSREFGHLGPIPAGPLAGLWDGAAAAARGVGDLLGGTDGGGVWVPDGGGSLAAAGINVEAFAFLLFAVVGIAGALRRLPLAYGAYAACLLALPLAYPRTADPGYDVPLFSLPRFVAVVFPLFMWLAVAVRERGWERQAIAVSALGLALYSAQWGTWQWVS
jgi:hypothetical protein